MAAEEVVGDPAFPPSAAATKQKAKSVAQEKENAVGGGRRRGGVRVRIMTEIRGDGTGVHSVLEVGRGTETHDE